MIENTPRITSTPKRPLNEVERGSCPNAGNKELVMIPFPIRPLLRNPSFLATNSNPSGDEEAK